MEIKAFTTYVDSLINEHQFDALLQTPYSQDPEVLAYLQGRELDIEGFEAYAFAGEISYQGKIYHIPKSVVVPLRDPTSRRLRGVWIRFIHEKRFFTWVCEPSFQKYWTFGAINPDKPVVVTEGIFDALSLLKLDIPESNIVAALGVSITNELRAIIESGSRVVLAFDNDKAGWTAMRKEVKKNPGYFALLIDSSRKDFNDIVVSKESLSFKIMPSILANVNLSSRLS